MLVWILIGLAAVTLHHAEACGGTFTEREGIIQSPRYPANYPNNQDCVYVINRPWGERITLSFTKFAVGWMIHHDRCRFGSLTIQDGSSEDAPVLGEFCGTELPPDKRSFQNSMRIRFRTNSYRTNTGFKATYTSAVHNDTFLLITDSTANSIYRIDYDTFSHMKVPVTRYPFSVDYDPVGDRMYWTDLHTREIRSARLNGSDSRALWVSRHAIASLHGLAVDPLSRLVFYMDTDSKEIGMVTIDSGLHKTILTVDIDAPRCITLDTMNGVMYWSDVGRREKIERANYDGSDRKVLVSTRLSVPNGLAVDVAKNRLYWVDAGTNKVETCDLNGNDRRLIYTHWWSWLYDPHYFGLALHKDKLYITDWGPSASETTFSYLLEMNTNGSYPREVGTARGKMNDVHIYSQDTWQQGPNGCGSNSNVCSHICIPTLRNTYKCVCPDGLSLAGDHRTCVNGVSSSTRVPFFTTTTTATRTSSTTARMTTTPTRRVSVEGPDLFHTNGTQTMTLVCDPDGSQPATAVTWNVVCDRQDHKRCVWRPLPPRDDGKLVRCSITYAGGQRGVGYFAAQLNYPPTSAPQIHGYSMGSVLRAGSPLTMTCVVIGGKPLVTSVSFSCNGHPDRQPDMTIVGQVQSPLVMEPVRAQDNGIRCTCTAKWARPDLYSLQASVVLSVTGSDPAPSSPQSSRSSGAVAGGVAAGVGVVVLIVIIIIAVVLIMKIRRKRRANSPPPPPVIWHAEENPYTPLGYPFHAPHGDPPPAYSNSIFDTLSNTHSHATEPAGAEGGHVVSVLPPKPGAPPTPYNGHVTHNTTQWTTPTKPGNC